MSLAAIAPSLPPTWQVIVGGILYANPVMRLASRAVRRVVSWFSKPKPAVESPPSRAATVIQKINQATGLAESTVGSLRDSIVSRAALAYAGASVVFGGDSVGSHTVSLAAAALSVLSTQDRNNRVETDIIHNQLSTGERLTPAGWRAQEAAALGVFAPDVPQHFPERDQTRGRMPNYGRDAKPGFSLRRNLRGLRTTLSIVKGPVSRSYARARGFWATRRSQFRTLFLNKHASPNKKHMEVMDVIMPHWVRCICESYGITLKIRGEEKLAGIPQHQMILSAWLHAGIYSDFLFWLAWPRARFVADKQNFHDSFIMRLTGIPWFLDTIGLPFAKRLKNGASGNGNGNGNLYKQMTELMAEHGVQPVFFGQGGRSEPAYNEDGSLDIPGIYSNVVKPENPERYYNLNGTIRAALELAKQSGQAAFIPILHIEGSGQVMPKDAKNPPFIQKVQPGDISFDIADVIRVEPPNADEKITQALIDRYVPKIVEAAKQATGDNERLRKRVAAWAGKSEVGEDFEKLARDNEIYYIIADRIRSVHTKNPNQQRRKFQERLLCVIADASKGRDVEVELWSLLAEVSRTIKKTKKHKPW